MAVLSAVQGKAERAAMARAHQEESDEAAHKLVLEVEGEVMKMEEKAEKEGRNEVDIASLVWSISDAIRYTVKHFSHLADFSHLTHISPLIILT